MPPVPSVPINNSRKSFPVDTILLTPYSILAKGPSSAYKEAIEVSQELKACLTSSIYPFTAFFQF